ncbi:peptidoglycan DD-metalloendopeptidase family protein [Streptomyces sp. NPDC058960]|uniref:aggregation-promoting factor C-terminal-like domain-containing protein n=1 Tax=Streptomyces sp. NPDC058960 TaxID=3346679 RepID=UPI0036C12637
MAGDLDIVGTAAVDVVPIAPNFHDKLKAIVLPAADRVGADAGRRMGDEISRHIVISIPDAINQGGQAARVAATRQGDNAGGAFASSLRRKLEAAFKAMPKLDIRLSDTGVDAELARLRAKLEQLSNKRIGVDISAEAARAEAARLEEQLQRLGANHPNVRIRVDTATARASLAAFREEIDAATATPGRIRMEVDGAFGAKLRAAVAQAQASLPNINVTADTSNARVELQRLREQMATLSEARVGIDVDAATARVQIDDIKRRLEILSIQRHDIDVRVDAARAAAELEALDAEADRLKLINIKAFADTSQAEGALMRLGIALGAVAALPIVPIAAAGIGAIASAAVAAGAGVGSLALVAIPAIKGVTTAIQAKTAAEKEAATATENSAAATVRAEQNALQMAGAQQALAAAHRNAARSIAQANRQIEDAERAVAQAAQQAADQRRQAAENVTRAERSLADAKKQSRQAEEDLTQARKDAAQQLAALDNKLTDGKLAQRDATLRVQEAELELNRVRKQFAAGQASELDVERARLGYDQAVQAQKEQAQAYKQLQKDAADAKKAGVDGNVNVKKAADALAKAQQDVRDQTLAVAKAHRDAARVEVQAAQSVADAQRRLADAVQNAADVQVQAADSIKSAERGVESARLSGINATQTATKQSDAYRAALAKLTPEQRKLFDSIAGPQGLTSAFKDWSKSLQPDVLPLFVRGIDAAKNSLPGLTPLVKTAADAVGDLFDRASKALKSPFWRGFKDDIDNSAKPAITGLGVAFGNVLTGIAGIIDAFLPHMDGISATMQRITKRFADWGKNLKGSPEFERFLQYVKDTSPGVAEFLGKLIKAAFDVSKALAPMSKVVESVFGPLLDGLSWLSQNAPGAIQVMWGIYAVLQAVKIGMAGFAIAMHLYEIAVAGATLVTSGWAAAIQATGIVPLIEAIVLAVAALVVGIIWAYKNVGWFRTAVDTAWAGIKIATVFLWEKILKPAFDGIWLAMRGIGAVAVWLWQTAIWPAFKGIWTVAKILFAILVTVVIAPIVIAVRLLGWWVMWLWRNVFSPAFQLIANLAVLVWNKWLWPFFQGFWNTIKWVGDKFVWLYDNAIKPAAGWIADKATWLWNTVLSPVFHWIWDGVKWVGEKFTWLYDHAVKPVAGWISDKATWLYDKGLKPAFDKVKSAVALVGDAFGLAKDAIKTAWDKVSDIAKKPVNFIIEWVYTKGIKAVWDKVASFVGLDKLPAAPKLLAAGGTVGDGWGIARPMKTNRPTAIVGEGNPRYPEYVIPTDPKYRGRALALHRQAGTQLLESGGILGGFKSAWDWTKDTVSDVIGTGIDWAKTGADLMLHPGKVWDKLMKPVLSRITGGIGASPMAKAVAAYPTRMVSGLKDMIVNSVTGMFSGGGGVGQWMKPVNVPFGTRFGVAGPMWSSGHHTGLDFPAPVGTPVHAVAGGTVMGVGTDGPYGNHVEINHGGGLTSLYAHMSKILTGLGEVVAQGQTIGKVGATGNVTGPHLHLEARVNGKPVDPMPYLTSIRAGTKTSKSIAAAKNFAKNTLGYFGWGPGEFPSLDRLWEGESNWRWDATNSSSGAYGIPQALPASKMASAGPDWRTNPATQIQWGLGYIRGAYGSPSNAWAKWLSRSPHWYDDGGYLPPGLSLVANGTGKPEPVFTGSQWDDLRAAKSAGGTTQVHADVRVFVGDREITDIVRTEVVAREKETASAINDGRWV